MSEEITTPNPINATARNSSAKQSTGVSKAKWYSIKAEQNKTNKTKSFRLSRLARLSLDSSHHTT
jgi:hypothetical protein